MYDTIDFINDSSSDDVGDPILKVFRPIIRRGACFFKFIK